MEAARLTDVFGIPEKYVDDPRDKVLIAEKKL
jgi:hypothetical protein